MSIDPVANRPKKSTSFGAALDRCVGSIPHNPSPLLTEEEGRLAQRRFREQEGNRAPFAGEGWRELKYGEIIEPTDEFLCNWRIWKTIGSGKCVGDKYDPIPAEPGFTKPIFHFPIRRKLTAGFEQERPF